MYCSKCGKMIPDGETICQGCLAAAKEDTDAEQQGYRILAVSVKTMLVISLCGGLGFGFSMFLMFSILGRGREFFGMCMLEGLLFAALFSAAVIPILSSVTRKRKDRFLCDFPQWRLSSESIICMGLADETMRYGAHDFLCLTSKRLIQYNCNKRGIVWEMPLNEILECVDKGARSFGVRTSQKGSVLKVGWGLKGEWIKYINQAIKK